jgi:pimeloyl-ACP methyl ester carboxylesterase
VPGTWRSVEGPAGQLRVYESPASPAASTVVLLCHDLPREQGGASDLGRAYPPLADRLSEECGCRVVAGMLRGAGGSAGDFSAQGWLDDLASLVDAEAGPAGEAWLVGFGLGGALALRTATSDARVRGVVSVAAPADFAGWVSNLDRFLSACRRSGVIRTASFPKDPGAWAAELVGLSPLEAAARLRATPLLVVHGSNDAEVPTAAARAIADAAEEGEKGASVDLRIVSSAGHLLMADPRVFATLVGWIERHR